MEEKFKSLLFEIQRIAKIGSWEVDLKQKSFSWSDEIYNILELDPRNTQLSFIKVQDYIHPEDRPVFAKAYRDLMRKNAEYDIESRVLLPDGRIKYIRTIGMMQCDAKGKPVRAIGIAQDISKLKNLEVTVQKSVRSMATLMGNLPGVAYRCKNDPDWTMEFMSQGVVNLTGYKPEALLNNAETAFNDLIVDEDREYVWSEIQKALKEKKYFQVAYRIKTKQGAIKWVWEKGVGLYKGKHVVALEGFITDITELKQAEDALLKAKLMAEESDRLKSAFLANMSHEIRTPMNSIVGFLDLLKEPELNGSEKLEYIGIVNKSSQRLLNTINDIIEASKIEAGHVELFPEVVNTEEVLQYHHEIFEKQAIEKGITLHLKNHMKGEDAMVETDKNKLESILGNLLNNAIKFTSKGGVEFGNSLEGGNLLFYVKDTGMGIPAERQEAVFERFVQADLNMTRPYEGSGLGLSIAREYARMLKGKIWLESEPGKGSTFFFSIPYQSVEKPQEPSEKSVADVDDFKPGSKILIAEDDDMGYQYYEIILDYKEISLLRTTNGADTVNMLKEQPDISLVLMDIKMPGMNGIEATREIRKFDKNIPIIAQTAHAMAGDREKLIEAGCNDYISKPVDRKKLLKMINQYIGKQ